jgi:hypothetical protein
MTRPDQPGFSSSHVVEITAEKNDQEATMTSLADLPSGE